MHFGGQRESAEGDGFQLDENPRVVASEQGDTPRVLGFEAENTIEVPLSGDSKEL